MCLPRTLRGQTSQPASHLAPPCMIVIEVGGDAVAPNCKMDSHLATRTRLAWRKDTPQAVQSSRLRPERPRASWKSSARRRTEGDRDQGDYYAACGAQIMRLVTEILQQSREGDKGPIPHFAAETMRVTLATSFLTIKAVFPEKYQLASPAVNLPLKGKK